MKSLSTFDIFVNADLLINQAEQLKRMNKERGESPMPNLMY
ncbi:MAG: hypothetical protein QXF41_03000 [Candidatus Micrarchaeaceae archaeon]